MDAAPSSPAATAPASPGTAIPSSASTPDADAGAVTARGDLRRRYLSLRSRHTFTRGRRYGRLVASWTALDAFRAARRALIRATAPLRPLPYGSLVYQTTEAERVRHHEQMVAWFAWAEAHVEALTYDERQYVEAVQHARRVKAVA
jgi:hypothetical protein